jgi:hypothetical protein
MFAISSSHGGFSAEDIIRLNNERTQKRDAELNSLKEKMSKKNEALNEKEKTLVTTKAEIERLRDALLRKGIDPNSDR